ncbi:MAG: sel1 repeat family protein [Bacteroidaceae bacterium]|nr:sel1 repeat family protein [Bacteroidaceae bacterium]
MDIKNMKVNGEDVPVNRQEFRLVTNPDVSFEDYGWTKEFVEDMLCVAENEPEHEWMSDHEILNNLGIVYSEAVGVEQDMEKAIMYFEKAIALDDDLARSNLADIYRKGVGGVPKNAERAFELYKSCKLPYAYFRVGEAYEYGRGVEQNLEEAKRNYRIAYEAGHGLARRKLQTLPFVDEYDDGEVWDARMLVKGYVVVYNCTHDENGYNNACRSDQIRLKRLASVIRGFTGCAPHECPNDTIKMLFDDFNEGLVLEKSPICFSDYKRIRNILDGIMSDDSRINDLFRMRYHRNLLRARYGMLRALIEYRVHSYQLRTIHSGVLCCPPLEGLAMYACDKLYNPHLDDCDDIIDEIIVLLLGKMFKKTISTRELLEKYDYPIYTDEELQDWELDNW